MKAHPMSGHHQQQDMSSESFQDRYLPLLPQLYRVALSILANVQDAEDAVNDTYLQLDRQRDRLASMPNAEGYFIVTLRNVCISMLRRRQVMQDVDEVDLPDESPDDGERDPKPGLWQKLLGKLTPKAKKIVELRHVAECSMTDIATLTGETEVNVRAILSRSRRKLREEYEQLHH